MTDAELEQKRYDDAKLRERLDSVTNNADAFGGMTTTQAREYLARVITGPSSMTLSQMVGELLTDEQATEEVRVRLRTRSAKWFARTLRDCNGRPFRYEIGYYRKGKWGARLSTVKWSSDVSMYHALQQIP